MNETFDIEDEEIEQEKDSFLNLIAKQDLEKIKPKNTTQLFENTEEHRRRSILIENYDFTSNINNNNNNTIAANGCNQQTVVVNKLVEDDNDFLENDLIPDDLLITDELPSFIESSSQEKMEKQELLNEINSLNVESLQLQESTYNEPSYSSSTGAMTTSLHQITQLKTEYISKDIEQLMEILISNVCQTHSDSFTSNSHMIKQMLSTTTTHDDDKQSGWFQFKIIIYIFLSLFFTL